MKKQMILGMLTAVGFAMGLLGCSKPETIDLNEYISIDISGYDNQGVAYLEFDEYELEEKVAEILGIKTEDSDINSFEDLEDAVVGWEKVNDVMNCVSFELSEEENLRNGDEIEVIASIDNETAKKYDIIFQYNDVKETVTGLQEIRVITKEELFKDVTVEFLGVSPEVEVEIYNGSEDEILSDISFWCEESYDLKIGDIVTVTASGTDGMEGLEFEEISKEYVVENVDYHVTEFNQISESDLNKILSHAESMVNEKLLEKQVDESFYEGDDFAGYMDHFDTLTGTKLDMIYFYSFRENALGSIFGNVNNAMRIVYRFDVTGMNAGWLSDYKNFDDCYIAVVCEDIVIDKEGELLFDFDSMYFSDGYSSKEGFVIEEVKEWEEDYIIEAITLE